MRLRRRPGGLARKSSVRDLRPTTTLVRQQHAEPEAGVPFPVGREGGSDMLTRLAGAPSKLPALRFDNICWTD
jgi:hypothetical protein